jgi:hypothetical protein
MQDAHTSHVGISILAFVQIKFKFLQVINIFAYIHFLCQWAISMEAKLIHKNVA